MECNARSEHGRSLLETLSVLVVIAILLIAALLGYRAVLHQWRKNQTVKQVAEVATRYRLRPILADKNDKKVSMKTLYPEGDRIDAYQVKTADEGRLHLEVLQNPQNFMVIINQVLDDSCEAILENGGYDAVLWKEGGEEFDKSKEYITIGSKLLKNWKTDGLPTELSRKTKEEVIAYICNNGKGKTRGDRVGTMSLSFGDKCPQTSAGHWYDGKCSNCAKYETQDKYGSCCREEERNECGVCHCPPMAPICKEDTAVCVECVSNGDCKNESKPVCDTTINKCVPCIPNTQEGCPDDKWCHIFDNNYYCDECLTDYDEKKDERGECSDADPRCDQENGPGNWICKSCSCEKEFESGACSCRGSGEMDDFCSLNDTSCPCKTGLVCTAAAEGSDEQCSTCQCASPEGETLCSGTEGEKSCGRQKNAVCSKDYCPCGKNENGVQLVCGNDNVCVCKDDSESCKDDSECCAGVCTDGKCGLPTCSIEKGDSCTNGGIAPECCSVGTCQGMAGGSYCCTNDGSEDSYCTSATNCCQEGLTCQNNQCKKACIATGLQTCDASHACCSTGENGDTCIFGTCCPKGANEDGADGAKCDRDECCKSGRCMGSEGNKHCCPSGDGSENSPCNADSCCGYGMICDINDGASEGVCKKPEICIETLEATCASDESGKKCCNATDQCFEGTCCPTDTNGDGSKGAKCSADACCSGDLKCKIPEGQVVGICAAECPTTETERKEIGSKCSEDCPCGIDAEQNQLICVPDSEGSSEGTCQLPPPECEPCTAVGEKCSEKCQPGKDSSTGRQLLCNIPEGETEGTCYLACTFTPASGTERGLGDACSLIPDCPCGTDPAGRELTCSVAQGETDGTCICPESAAFWFQAPGKITGRCCPVEGGIPNDESCTDDGSCCQSGNCARYTETSNTGTCCPEGVGVDADGNCALCGPVGTTDGAACSTVPDCPCGIREDGVALECNSNNLCCPKETPNFVEAAGRCCLESKVIALGEACEAGSCCADNGVCVNGLCCPSGTPEGGLPEGSEYTEGVCGGCAAGLTPRQVFTKKSSSTTKSYPCKKLGKKHCETTCGGKSCWYECNELDWDNPIERYSSYRISGMAGTPRCCEGNGDIGSPCSEDCPCQGTMSMYYRDGKLVKTDASQDLSEKDCYYDACSCTTKCTAELYCNFTFRDPVTGKMKGTCEKNSKTVDGKVVSYDPLKVNCVYPHDFEYTKMGYCYNCPADASFRENSKVVACCPPYALTASAKDEDGNELCKQYKKEKGYISGHTGDELPEGFYYDERGYATLCPSGHYCQNGQKYVCPAGTYSDTQGATSCHACGKGYICPEGSTQRTKCGTGRYCPDDFGSTSQACPPGKTTDSTGSTKPEDCKDCPRGYYCPGGMKNIACDNSLLKGICPNLGMEKPIEPETEDGKAQYVAHSKLFGICPKGSYCKEGTKYTCKAGTYSDYVGAAQCKPAPEGVAIADTGSQGKGDAESRWRVCPAGTYAEGTGNTVCKKCPSGTYQDKTGQGSCKQCPSDKPQSSEGAKGVGACSACSSDRLARTSSTTTKCCATNYFAVTDESTGFQTCCSGSSEKRYCWTGSSYTCSDPSKCKYPKTQECKETEYLVSGKCTSCPAGKSCNGKVAEDCPAGTYATAGSGVCTPCAPGTYQDKTGRASCIAAVKAQYVSKSGAKTYSTCNYKDNKVPNKDHTACESCPTGRKAQAILGVCVGNCRDGYKYVSGTCAKCDMNHYCDGAEEYKCPSNEYSMPGASECTSCSAGTYWDSNAGECKQCTAGYYCENGVKTKCSSGTTSGPGSSKCISCNPGEYFKTNDKGGACVKCDKGYYSKGKAATSCTVCPEGTYASEKGVSSCTPCPEGKYQPSKGSTSCRTCSSGEWTEGTGTKASSGCKKTYCTDGYRCDKGEKTPCPEGNYCQGGSVTACPKGTYNDQTGQSNKSSCKQCPEGTFANGTGKANCTECSKGLYSEDGKSCKNCGYGKDQIFTRKNGFQICCSTNKKYDSATDTCK